MAVAGAAAGAVGKSGVGKLISGLGGIGGALSIGSSLLGLIGGIGQKAKAKKMLKGLKDPGYQIPDEFKTNVFEAEQAARRGLPAQEYNLASTNIQRGTQAGLRQLGRMSNPFAGIAGLARSQSDSFAQLDASNAAARRQNMLQAMGARREMAGQRLNQQQYEQRRYEEAVNEANAMMGAGQQNTAGGLGSLGQLGMMQSVYGDKTQYFNKNRNKTAAGAPAPAPAPAPATTPSYSVPGMPGFMQGKFGGYMGGGYYGKINPLTGLPY